MNAARLSVKAAWERSGERAIRASLQRANADLGRVEVVVSERAAKSIGEESTFDVNVIEREVVNRAAP